MSDFTHEEIFNIRKYCGDESYEKIKSWRDDAEVWNMSQNIRTKDIMTPRTVVFALPEDITVEQVMLGSDRLHFSRIPVYGKNLDDIKGFVLKSDILHAIQETPETLLKDLCRPIVVVLDKLTLHDLFEQMMNESTHIALVVDEYGGTEGVVTMEDFIETLLGLEIG